MMVPIVVPPRRPGSPGPENVSKLARKRNADSAMSHWPELPYDSWIDTRETLHRWMQVVGKIQMELTPVINHWWNVALHVTARGLGTDRIPTGHRWFDMEFDFVSHVLRVRVSDGALRDIPLKARSVADLHDEVFSVLNSLAIECKIWTTPVEIPENAIPLDADERHRAYDKDAVERFWRILGLTDEVFTEFRARFIGKCSPVNFYWGSFDLAVTRFSGRPAPPRPGADSITREAYSHEVSSVGFWPGDERLMNPTFYSYASPEPEGFRTASISPAAAYYHEKLGGFYLLYDEVRKAADPKAVLLEFCQSTYEAAATLGKWDREALERKR